MIFPPEILLFGFPVLLLGVLSASVSAVETAIGAVDSGIRRQLRQEAPSAGKWVESILEDPRVTTNALLLTGAMLNALLLLACLVFLQSLPTTGSAPGLLAFFLVFLALIVFCEILPKVLALRNTVQVLRASVWAGRMVLPSVLPVVRKLQALVDRAVVFLPPTQNGESDPEATRMEFLSLIELAGTEGTILESEAAVIREIVKLGGESAPHCMTPRVDTFFLEDDLAQAEALAQLRHQRYCRVPVSGETPDELLGVLDVPLVLLVPETHYLEHLQPPAFIPDTMNALDLLHSFLLKNQRFAILLDEYGGFEGIVTLSDLIEEVFGTEGPSSGSGLYLESLGPDRCLASGSARLDDLVELLLWEDLETSADTLGGLISEIQGAIPRPGTTLEVAGWYLHIRRASRKRVKEVLLERAPGGNLRQMPPLG